MTDGDKYTVFQAGSLTAGGNEYLDLSGIFPGNVAAYFLLGKGSKREKKDIGNFLENLGLKADNIIKPRQIHSSIILENGDGLDGDGVFTEKAGEAVAIAVADCVPILISTGNGKAVIALHSGWKGTIGRIAEKTFHLFPPELYDAVWIGPSIRQCCYEVGVERIKAFREAFPESAGIDDEKRTLDLAVINAGMFYKAGVNKEKIFIDGRCTCCSDASFASYRRDGEKAGRMVVVAVRT